MKKSTFFSLLAVLVLVVVLGSFANAPDSSQIVRAGTGDNVFGWAWANTPQSLGDPVTGTDQGVGWISLNSLNCDADGDGNSDGTPSGCPIVGTPVENYGVSIDLETTGDFSGFAWSDNIGWISFNRADTNNPPEAPFNTAVSTDPIARLDGASGEVTGWARALSGIGATNGYDGWIKLSGVADDGSPYGVTLTNNEFFEGYAWGGDVIGWVDFNFNGLNDGNGVTIGGPTTSVGIECSNDSDDTDIEDILADRADPGCYGDPNNLATYDTTDDDERNCLNNDCITNGVLPECSDWVDNDGDGRCDFSGECFDEASGLVSGDSDPNCGGPNDSESTPTIAVCGDGTIQAPIEVCDGVNLNSETCLTQGFTGGTLGCSSGCDTFDVSSCTGAGCNNNGVCDAGETPASCPSDCLIFEEF